MGLWNKVGNWLYEITDPIEKGFKATGRMFGKIILRLIAPVFFGSLAYYFSPGDISEIPFAQLTLKDIGGLAASICFGYIAIHTLLNHNE